jgi:hypothetical protein
MNNCKLRFVLSLKERREGTVFGASKPIYTNQVLCCSCMFSFFLSNLLQDFEEADSSSSVVFLHEVSGGISLQHSSEGCTKVRKSWRGETELDSWNSLMIQFNQQRLCRTLRRTFSLSNKHHHHWVQMFKSLTPRKSSKPQVAATQPSKILLVPKLVY